MKTLGEEHCIDSEEGDENSGFSMYLLSFDTILGTRDAEERRGRKRENQIIDVY